MRTTIFVAVLTLASLIASVAEARHVHYAGPHPIAARYGGGYCYIQTPHMHVYAPDHAGLYQQVNDQYVFTGDPTPFGYDGDKYKYYGHHPVISVDGQILYCYIDGPHFHAAPPPDDGYKVKDGVAFYVGPFDPAYAALRPHRVKVVNAEYRPYVSFRPVVEVQPPPEWHGEVYVPGPPGVVVGAPGVVVGAPGVVVEAPAPGVVVEAPPPPRVDVRVRAPVVVAPPPPHVFIGAPAPHVVVGAPPPVYVGPRHGHVVVGAPPPPGVVVGAPGVVVEHRHHDEGHWDHHDHGKHKGWYK